MSTTRPSRDARPGTAAAIDAFIARWGASAGAERANYQLFLAELCDVLSVPRPEPSVADEAANTSEHQFVSCARSRLSNRENVMTGEPQATDDSTIDALIDDESHADCRGAG